MNAPRARRLVRLAAIARERLTRRHPGLLRERGTETLPVRLDQRRIYVLPTGFGVGFAVLLMVMLLGALNYNNNAALLLTCLLGATAAQSMLGAFRTLHGLSLERVRGGSAQAGGQVRVELVFAASVRTRHGLEIEAGPARAAFALPADVPGCVALELHCPRRGWQALPPLRLGSSWPFGLFRAWSWLRPQARMLVYPRTEAGGPSPPQAGGPGDTARHRGTAGDEPAGLRDYQPGDPPRHIAWKPSARSGQLLLRLHEPPREHADWRLRWQDTRGLPHEQRIERLARWVQQAHLENRRWTLELPQGVLGPDRGSGHCHACLAALALLP